MIKKTLEIHGSVSGGLVIGHPAFIRETNGTYRRTSQVRDVKALSKNAIRFETMNTVYVLHLQNPREEADRNERNQAGTVYPRG